MTESLLESTEKETRSNRMGHIHNSATNSSQNNVICLGDSHILTPLVSVPFDASLEAKNDSIKSATFAQNGATVKEIEELIESKKHLLQITAARSKPTIILSAGINDIFRAHDLENFSGRYENLTSNIEQIFGKDSNIVCLAPQAWATAYLDESEQELHEYREANYDGAKQQMKGVENDEAKRNILIDSTASVIFDIERICEKKNNLHFCSNSYHVTSQEALNAKEKQENILVDGEHFRSDVVEKIAESVSDFLTQKELINQKTISNQR